jgi:hypothetical protein
VLDAFTRPAGPHASGPREYITAPVRNRCITELIAITPWHSLNSVMIWLHGVASNATVYPKASNRFYRMSF